MRPLDIRFNPTDERYLLAQFAALKKIIGGAKLFELTYAEAADAGRKLRGLCHGSS